MLEYTVGGSTTETGTDTDNRFELANHRNLNISLAGVKVRIDAPPVVLAVLEATMSYVPRDETGAEPVVLISAQRKDDVWEVRGPDGSLKLLDGQSALPRVGGAVVTSALQATASARNMVPLRAAVVERNGRALALVGDDWESATTLGAHLHCRGWSYVGSDNALLETATLEVLPVQKSLYVNSSSVRQFPLHFRRALETSPWYVTPQGISFYAVDPLKVGLHRTWTLSAVLAGVIVIDGAVGERPCLESIDAAQLRGERLGRLAIDWDRVKAVDLRLGGCVETSDLIDYWFESIRV